MNERTRNIIVGITLVVGVVGVAVMLLLFGYARVVFDRGYPLTVQLSAAGGLGEESRVMLSGIDIGSVRTIELMDPPTAGVQVVAQIRPDIRLPRDTRATIAAPMLLGGSATLVLDLSHLSSEHAQDLLPTDGTAVLVGEVPEPLTKQLKNMFSGPAEQFERVAVTLEKLSTEWVEVGRNVNLLIEPRSPEQVDRQEVLGNLSSLLTRADLRLKELAPVLTGIDRWANDDELREQIKSAAADASQLAKRYVAVADDLAGTIASLHEAIDQARTGQGTVGKLLNDPALYNNLNDAAERLSQAVTELRLLIEKWKAEGLPVQF